MQHRLMKEGPLPTRENPLVSKVRDRVIGVLFNL